MTELTAVQTVLAESEPDQWIPFSEMGVWTYSEDVDLRIERYEQLESDLVLPWTQHLQGTSQSFSYLVYYGSSPVEYHTIAAVDNFRAHIPFPQQPSDPNEPFTITPYQATLGLIITGNEKTFHAYLDNTGIEIRD